MKLQTIYRRAAFAFGLMALGTAQAQEPKESVFGLGVGVGYQRQPYRDFDDKASPIPYIVYENRWASVAGPTADLKLVSTSSLSLRLRAKYAFGEGYEADDSPYLVGMAERKASFWLGGAAVWRTDLATLSAELLGDGSGESKGSRFSLAIERRFSSGKFDFTPRLAVHRLDRKFVDYYYGVRAQEATALRPAYEGKSTTNVELALQVGYSLAPRQRLMLDVGRTQLGSGIKESPLVDRSNQMGARLGYLYMF